MYTIAVTNNGVTLGYYVADDQDLVPQQQQAAQYATLAAAQADAAIIADDWDLDDEDQVVVQAAA